LEEIRATLGDTFTKCVPLMDGGIFDNQGVDSVVKAYERGNQQIGLLIVSDTTQRKPSLFEFSPEKKRGSLTLSTLVQLAWIVFSIACITSGVLLTAWIVAVAGDGPRLVHLFLYGVPLILSAFLAAALYWIRRQYQEGEKRVAELTSLELWPFVKHLTVPDLIGLISGRAKSLIVLTASIFMKRVRAMVYRDIKVHPSYLNRQVSNLIYDLDDTGKFSDDIVAQLAPTSELRNLAIRAEKMETTLWINNPEDLRDLIACGHATTCFNIMRYILDKRRNELNTSGSREEDIYNRALALWEMLKQDRYTFLSR